MLDGGRPQLFLDRQEGVLWAQTGARFDPAQRRWQPPADSQAKGEPVEPLDAVRWLQKESGTPCRPPVGVIGGREAEVTTLETAHQLGRALGAMGLTLLCGGKGGVMEAACRGCHEVGGLSVGLLPDDHWQAANDYVDVPMATGIGVARNAIIARAAFCLVAVGGGYGTTSEAAFALQFGRPVFALAGAPELTGIRRLNDSAEAAGAVAEIVLDLENL